MENVFLVLLGLGKLSNKGAIPSEISEVEYTLFEDNVVLGGLMCGDGGVMLRFRMYCFGVPVLGDVFKAVSRSLHQNIFVSLIWLKCSIQVIRFSIKFN